MWPAYNIKIKIKNQNKNQMSKSKIKIKIKNQILKIKMEGKSINFLTVSKFQNTNTKCKNTINSIQFELVEVYLK